MKNEYIIKGKKFSQRRLILAHGAGAAMDSAWMELLTKKLVQKEIQVIRFNFPYMVKAMSEAKKYPPNRQEILLESWEKVIEKYRQMGPLFIGGKSMGGRMASLIADSSKVDGLICFGFPFYAPGKEIGVRAEHLKKIVTPTLILQGTRDSMGNKEGIKKVLLGRKVKLHWFEGGDHSLSPLKSVGVGLDAYLEEAAEETLQFMNKVLHL